MTQIQLPYTLLEGDFGGYEVRIYKEVRQGIIAEWDNPNLVVGLDDTLFAMAEFPALFNVSLEGILGFLFEDNNSPRVKLVSLRNLIIRKAFEDLQLGIILSNGIRLGNYDSVKGDDVLNLNLNKGHYTKLFTQKKQFTQEGHFPYDVFGGDEIKMNKVWTSLEKCKRQIAISPSRIHSVSTGSYWRPINIYSGRNNSIIGCMDYIALSGAHFLVSKDTK